MLLGGSPARDAVADAGEVEPPNVCDDCGVDRPSLPLLVPPPFESPRGGSHEAITNRVAANCDAKPRTRGRSTGAHGRGTEGERKEEGGDAMRMGWPSPSDVAGGGERSQLQEVPVRVRPATQKAKEHCMHVGPPPNKPIVGTLEASTLGRAKTSCAPAAAKQLRPLCGRK